MKVKLTRLADGFGGIKQPQFRIVELPEGEPIPEGATEVSEDTPVTHDWEAGNG